MGDCWQDTQFIWVQLVPFELLDPLQLVLVQLAVQLVMGQ
jgi:hypothetical protein